LIEATTRRRIAATARKARGPRPTNVANPFSHARLSLKQVDGSVLGDIERLVLTATLWRIRFRIRQDKMLFPTGNGSQQAALACRQPDAIRPGRTGQRFIDYMKNTLEWTFVACRPQFASAFFFTFDKGQLRSFRSSVNSVNLGIRMQSSEWTPSNGR
jgi:hypothetical protein